MKQIFILMFISLVLFVIGVILTISYPLCYIEYLFTKNRKKKSLKREVLRLIREIIRTSFNMDSLATSNKITEAVNKVREINSIKD